MNAFTHPEPVTAANLESTMKARTSAPATAYLQHLESKAQSGASHSYNDHRQTIVSPVQKAKARAGVNGATKKKKKTRPPLCKNTRSVMSEATNSTYLSSDSEEDHSLHSGTSNRSQFSHRSASTKASRESGASSTKSRNERNPENVTNAMVPFGTNHLTSSSQHSTGSYASSNSSGSHCYNHASSSNDFDNDDLAILQYSDNEQEYSSDEDCTDLNNRLVSSSSDDEELADLDTLLQESSDRWKQQAAIESFSPSVVTPPRLADNALCHVHEPNSKSSTSLQVQQQAEIDALRSALQQLQVHHTTGTGSATAAIPSAVAIGQHEDVTDELTVASGLPVRPDAASVCEAPMGGRSFTARTNLSSSSPHQQDLVRETLLLQSSVSGVTRKATFSGSVTRRNHAGKITGKGTLTFNETGDVYYGNVVDSEMHGPGKYTTKDGSAFAGVFSHNVFTG